MDFPQGKRKKTKPFLFAFFFIFGFPHKDLICSLSSYLWSDYCGSAEQGLASAACLSVRSRHSVNSRQDGWVWAWSFWRWGLCYCPEWIGSLTHSKHTHTLVSHCLVTGRSAVLGELWVRQTCPKRHVRQHVRLQTGSCRDSPSCNRRRNFSSASVSMASMNSYRLTENQALRPEEINACIP